MISSKTLKGFLATSFLGAAMALQGCVGAPERQPDTKSPVSDVKTEMTKNEQTYLFQTVMEIVRQVYVDPARGNDNERLVGEALKGVMKALDPHSDYLTPKEYADAQREESGKYGGVGMEMGIDKDGHLKVIAPYEGNPAEKAGIKADDIIMQIDGRDIKGLTPTDASNLILGDPQTPVTLTVQRHGANEPTQITIIRNIIKKIDVKATAIGSDIAYVRINSFNTQGVAAQFNEAVNTLKTQMGGHPSAYIIDVRGNGGGFVNEVLSITDDLIDGEQTVLSVRGRKPEDSMKYISSPGDITEGKPMILLVDGGSASASEILAGALQDTHRATILGNQTYGKGSVQQIFPAERFIPGQKGGIKLTIELYFTPAGRSIQGQGITPDVLFMPPEGTKLPEYERESEQSNVIARPDSQKDETVTTQMCKAAQTTLPAGTQLKTPLTDLRNAPDYALLCAVETLRKAPQLTVMSPYIAPPPKPAMR